MTPARSLILPSLRSLAGNNLTNAGKDMSGVLKLAEALPQSKLQSLKCVPTHVLAFLCSAPDEHFDFCCTCVRHSISATKLDAETKEALKHAAGSSIDVHLN